MQARADWHRMEQTSEGQSRPEQRELPSRRGLASGPPHSHAVSQVNCLALNKVSFFTPHPQITTPLCCGNQGQEDQGVNTVAAQVKGDSVGLGWGSATEGRRWS